MESSSKVETHKLLWSPEISNYTKELASFFATPGSINIYKIKQFFGHVLSRIFGRINSVKRKHIKCHITYETLRKIYSLFIFYKGNENYYGNLFWRRVNSVVTANSSSSISSPYWDFKERKISIHEFATVENKPLSENGLCSCVDTFFYSGPSTQSPSAPTFQVVNPLGYIEAYNFMLSLDDETGKNNTFIKDNKIYSLNHCSRDREDCYLLFEINSNPTVLSYKTGEVDKNTLLKLSSPILYSISEHCLYCIPGILENHETFLKAAVSETLTLKEDKIPKLQEIPPKTEKDSFRFLDI